MRAEKRINDIVNRLNRTKVERKPDLKGKLEMAFLLKFSSGIHDTSNISWSSHLHIITCICTSKTVDKHFVFHYTAEREAVNAAERAERKQHLRDKVGDNFLFGL